MSNTLAGWRRAEEIGFEGPAKKEPALKKLQGVDESAEDKKLPCNTCSTCAYKKAQR